MTRAIKGSQMAGLGAFLEGADELRKKWWLS
jgi:hypothetical protein